MGDHGRVDGHLRIEEVNRLLFKRDSRWVPERTPSVLDEHREGASDEEPGDLVPRRALAAIMITDMVGFSREMQHSEERTYSKLRDHNEIIRSRVTRNSGKEVKTIGDAFLVRFDSAVDAVKAALEIQSELARYNASRSDDGRILIRIGIHTGDILMMDDDVLGNGVNLAARIEPLAEPGGICISEDTYNLVRFVVDLDVFSLGKRELKNIEDPPEVFKIMTETVAGDVTTGAPQLS